MASNKNVILTRSSVLLVSGTASHIAHKLEPLLFTSRLGVKV